MKHRIIFKALVGSRAHGTATPESDEDFSGVYVQNNDDILSYGYEEMVQVNKDEKYYEVKRFLDLLSLANPSALELLFSPNDCIIETSPEFKLIYNNRYKFLTKKCYDTFSGYAKTQISKSKGTNKKINWEKERIERKTPIDFCYVEINGKTKPLNDWMNEHKMEQERCGLTNLTHFRDCYALYYDEEGNKNYRGIITKNSNELRLSSICSGIFPTAIMFYNKDAYTTHCKDYKSYETWIKERNLNRFHTNVSHGQIFDSKNLSHCVRLINVSKEIATKEELFVRRTNDIEYLLSIKRGEVSLDEIINNAERDIKELKELYDNSKLPEDIENGLIKELLLKIRKMN